MNGFTKPLEISFRLHETPDRYGLGTSIDTTPTTSTASPDSVPIDLARLNELTEGDAEFAHELAATFIASGEQVIAGNPPRAGYLRSRGHCAAPDIKLKGASANIHAEPLCKLAFELEINGVSLDQPLSQGADRAKLSRNL